MKHFSIVCDYRGIFWSQEEFFVFWLWSNCFIKNFTYFSDVFSLSIDIAWMWRRLRFSIYFFFYSSQYIFFLDVFFFFRFLRRWEIEMSTLIMRAHRSLVLHTDLAPRYLLPQIPSFEGLRPRAEELTESKERDAKLFTLSKPFESLFSKIYIQYIYSGVRLEFPNRERL